MSASIEAASAGILYDPSDLPVSEDFLGEDGLPDITKIRAAAEELASRKPHLARPRGSAGQGARSPAEPAFSLAGMSRARDRLGGHRRAASVHCGPRARGRTDPGNLIAAGFVDTPLSASLLGDRLEDRRNELRATLPIGRVVGPIDVAALAVHIMTNTALTGATYDIDGGQQFIAS